MMCVRVLIDNRIDQTQRTKAGRLPAQKDIPGNIEVEREVQFLVNQRDAEALRVFDRGDCHGFAADANGARIGALDAAENFHER